MDTNQEMHPARATHALDHQESNIVKSKPTTYIRNIFYLSRSWKPLIHTLEDCKKSFPKYKPQLCFPSSCSRAVALSMAYGSHESAGAQPPFSHPWLQMATSVLQPTFCKNMSISRFGSFQQ